MTKVFLSELLPEKRVKVEEEIRRSLETVLGSRDPSCIKSIIVTPNFADAVRLNFQSPDDHFYDQVHQWGNAIGRVLPIIEEGKLNFILIFDSQIFESWGYESSVVERLVIYLHELKHVKDYFWRYNAEGYSWIFAVPKTKDELLFENAWAIAFEYSAYKFSRLIVFETYRDNGQNVTFQSIPDQIRKVEMLLSDFVSYLEMANRDFKDKRLNINGVLNRYSDRIGAILRVCASVYGVGEFDANILQQLDKIEENLVFKRFFTADWAVIHESLQKYYYEKDYAKAKVQLIQISNLCSKIYEKCGMCFSDSEKGILLKINYL